MSTPPARLSCGGTAGVGTQVEGVPQAPSRPLPTDCRSCPPSVLRQALRQKHQEAQQSCRPHNLPVLQAAQQRELEVGAQQGG